MYRTLSTHYREKYGSKVYKLAIDAGFTCPNRDGTCGSRGCIFCAGDGSGAFAQPKAQSVAQQLHDAQSRVRGKYKGDRFIAYFQSFTNTYAEVSTLRSLFESAMEPEWIVGLAIGTRPDCLGDDVIALLKELNERKPISIELGLQTVHPETAAYIRRGYETDVYFDAVKRLKAAGIEVVTHIILGLPGETRDMMLETTRQAVQAGTDGIKFHLLHVLRGTDLEKEYLDGKFECLTMEEYGAILKKCIDILPEHVTVHRITGDGAKKDLIAPMWSADKKHVLNYLTKILADT